MLTAFSITFDYRMCCKKAQPKSGNDAGALGVLPPSGFDIPTYNPPEAIDRVLEVPAGTVKLLGIQKGDVIELTQ